MKSGSIYYTEELIKMDRLEEVIEKLEQARSTGKKVKTQNVIEYCKKNNIAPPTMFKEAAKKGLLGVFR